MAEKKEEKIKINPNPLKQVELIYPLPIMKDGEIIHSKDEQKILINPIISLKDKIMLFHNYVDSYFKDGEVVSNYIDARYGLIFGITDLCTNIDIQSLDIDEYICGLWKEVYSRIANYNDFMSDIYNIVKTIADNSAVSKSVGSVIDKVAGDLIRITQKMDLSPEGIKDLVGELQGQTKEFDEKYVSPPKNETPKENETIPDPAESVQ
jgi:hypothetical protein